MEVSSNEQNSGKMWAGRFRVAPDATFDAWQRSLPFDWQLLDAELAASRAHALALEAAGILTAEECARIMDALEANWRELRWPERGSGAGCAG